MMKFSTVLISLVMMRSVVSIFGAADDFDFGGGSRAKKNNVRLQKCEAEKRDQKVQLAGMQSDMEEYKNLISRLEKKVEDLTDNNSELRGRLDRCMANGANNELTQQINELRVQNKDLLDDNRNFVAEIESLRVEITNLKTSGGGGNCDGIRAENARLVSEIQALEAENSTLNVRITELNVEIKNGGNLKAENAQLRITVDGLSFDLQRVVAENSNCQARVGELAGTITQLEGQLSNITTLQAEITQLDRELNSRNRTIEEQSAKIDELNATITELNNRVGEVSSLTIIIEQLERDLDNERTLNIELKSQINTLKVSLVDFSNASDNKLQARIASLVSENEGLLQQINSLRMTISDLKKSLRVQQHNEGNSSCMIQLKSMKVEINKLTQINTQLEKEISIIMGKGNEIVDANELLIGNAWTNDDTSF